MKKTRLFLIILCFCVLIQTLSLPSFAQEQQAGDVSVSSGCNTLDGQVPLYGKDKMLKSARAAFLYEVNSETLLYAYNPDELISPASLVKIMTCLVVLDNCDISEKVVVTESAMATISKGSATLKLQPGEEFTVDQLLYGLMVGSANDAAVVLAEHAAGSQGAFVNLMNKMSREIGCVNTVYANAHGLNDAAQITTARDVAKLVNHAMKSEQFMVYFGKSNYEMPATEFSEARSLETSNYLNNTGTINFFDSRCTGGRTGITPDNRRSIVVTANSKGLNYIAVILSAETEYNDRDLVKYYGNYEEAQELFKLGFGSQTIYQVLYDGQILSQFNVIDGTNHVSVGPLNTADCVLPSDAKMEDLMVRFGNLDGSLQAPIKEGEEISTAEVWYGSVCIAYSPVITLNGSQTLDHTKVLENRYGGGSKAWVIIAIIALVIAVGAGVVYIFGRTFRGMQNAKMQRRYRKRRSERRRTR